MRRAGDDRDHHAQRHPAALADAPGTRAGGRVPRPPLGRRGPGRRLRPLPGVGAGRRVGRHLHALGPHGVAVRRPRLAVVPRDGVRARGPGRPRPARPEHPARELARGDRLLGGALEAADPYGPWSRPDGAVRARGRLRGNPCRLLLVHVRRRVPVARFRRGDRLGRDRSARVAGGARGGAGSRRGPPPRHPDAARHLRCGRARRLRLSRPRRAGAGVRAAVGTARPGGGSRRRRRRPGAAGRSVDDRLAPRLSVRLGGGRLPQHRPRAAAARRRPPAPLARPPRVPPRVRARPPRARVRVPGRDARRAPSRRRRRPRARRTGLPPGVVVRLVDGDRNVRHARARHRRPHPRAGARPSACAPAGGGWREHGLGRRRHRGVSLVVPAPRTGRDELRHLGGAGRRTGRAAPPRAERHPPRAALGADFGALVGPPTSASRARDGCGAPARRRPLVHSRVPRPDPHGPRQTDGPVARRAGAGRRRGAVRPPRPPGGVGRRPRSDGRARAPLALRARDRPRHGARVPDRERHLRAPRRADRDPRR